MRISCFLNRSRSISAIANQPQNGDSFLKWSRFDLRLGALLLLAVLCISAVQVQGQSTLTWDSDGTANGTITDGSGTWDTTSTNWTGDGGTTNQAFVASDDAVFGGGSAGASGTITLGENLTSGRITSNAANGGGTYIIDTSTFTLTTLNTEGGFITNDIDVNENLTIQSGTGGGVQLGRDFWTQISSGKTLTINSDISSDTGDRSLIMHQGFTGTLVLSGTNNTANNGINAIQLRNGTIQFSNDSNLGDNSLAFGYNSGQDGTLEYVGTGGSVDNNVQIGSFGTNTDRLGGGSILNNGTGNLVFSDGTFNSAQVGTVARTLKLGGSFGDANEISGIIIDNAGTVAITKEGTNTWNLNGNNTYTGATTVSAGLLRLNGTNTSDITVADGASFGGGGSTTGSLTFAPGNTTFEFDATAGAFNVGNVLTTTGSTVTVNVTGTTSGAVTILDYTGGSYVGSASAADFTGGTGASARGAVFVDTGSAITYDAGTVSNVWTGATNGNWNNGVDANWVGGASDNLFFDNDGAIFTDSTVDAAAPSTAQTVTLTGDVTPSSVAFTSNSAGVTYTIDAASTGSITGSTSLTKSGTADVTINNANTYTGGTTLSQGTLILGNTAALGTGTIRIEDFGDNPALVFQSLTGTVTNNISVDNTGGPRFIEFNGGTTLTLSGDIVFEGFNGFRNIIQLGGGDVTLSGLITGSSGPDVRENGTLRLTNDANSFGGPTFGNRAVTIRNDATLEVTSIADAGSNSALGVGNEINFGAGGADGTLIYIGTGDSSTNRQANIGDTNATGDGSATILNNGTGTLQFTAPDGTQQSGTTDFNIARAGVTAARTLTLGGTNTGDNRIASAIIDNNTVGGGTISIIKEGAGKWILSGTNTYTGTTTINAGTLSISDETNLGAPGAFAADALNINGGTLNTSATFTINDANRGVTVTDGTIDTDVSTTVTIDNVIAGTTLNKTGAGTLALGNAANTFTGLDVQAGTVQLNVADAIPTTATVVVGASSGNATLDLDGFDQTVDGITLGAASPASGSLTSSVVGAGTLTLSNNLTYNAGGGGALDNGGATISSNVDLGTGNRQVVVNDSSNAADDLTISGVVSGSNLWIKSGEGTLVLSNAGNNYTGSTFHREGTIKVGGNEGLSSASTIVFQSAGTGTTATSSTIDLAGNTTTINALTNFGGAVETAGFQGIVTDSVGGGLLKLGGNVTYNVSTNANAYGTMTIGGNLDLNGATRTFTINDTTGLAVDTLVSGVIQNSSGTAGLTKTGDGTLQLSGNNTYNGDTTVSAGTLALSHATSTNTIANSPTIIVDSGATLDVSGVSAGFEVASGQTLRGEGTVTGNTTIGNGGTLAAGTTVANDIGTLSFSNDLTSAAGSTWLVDLNAAVSGDSDLIAVTGNLSLSGPTFPTLALNDFGTFIEGNVYSIATYSSLAVGSQFNGLGENAIVVGSQGSYRINYGAGAITLTAVPEPLTILPLVGLLFAGFLMIRRRRKVSA